MQAADARDHSQSGPTRPQWAVVVLNTYDIMSAHNSDKFAYIATRKRRVLKVTLSQLATPGAQSAAMTALIGVWWRNGWVRPVMGDVITAPRGVVT